MAIGVNWAEIWAPVWKAVWTQEAPEPPQPDPEVAQPAGSSRRRRHRYYVEIDGQQFEVRDQDEALELLQRARAIAEREAEKKADRATKLLRKKREIPRVKIASPAISVSPELKEVAAPLVADISRLYARAEEIAELRLLMLKALRKQREDDDDDDEILLLM